MERFRVTFFKQLTNSSGHPFKCAQGEVTISDSVTPQQALETAERRFARAKGVTDWTCRADVAELVCSGSGTGPDLVHRAGRQRATERI